MFGKFKSMMKLSEASNIIKAAIREVSLGDAGPDVEAFSTRLIANLYASKPELFDGKMGARPHAVATAAAALAQGLHELNGGDDAESRTAALALGNILLSASTHSKDYGFTGHDVPLLKIAEREYLEHVERNREATDRIVGSLGL